MSEQQRLRVVPCSFQAANAEVARLHRHHLPIEAPPGRYKLALAVVDETGRVRGAAIFGRPVGANRMKDGEWVAEVARVATDGCPNACSALYAAMARAAKAMGYARIITYILDSEPGTSLKAAGWKQDAGSYGGQTWRNHPRPGYDRHPMGLKGRWSLELNPVPASVQWAAIEDSQEVLAL